MCRFLVPYYLSLRGKRARRKGQYSIETLNIFKKANSQTSNVNIKFYYLFFLRHLGFVIDVKGFNFILDSFHRLKPKNKILALNFIIEYRPSYDLFKITDEIQLLKFANRSPAISNFLKSNGSNGLDKDSELLSNFFERRREWNEQFSHYLKSNIKSVCVVGNSYSSEEKVLGSRIDSMSIVVRFNSYFSDDIEVKKNRGEKTNVWITSPNFIFPDKPSEEDCIDWVIISGPDICFTMSKWSEVNKNLRRGSKVITPPLHIWRQLVSVLEAPPSAGVLIIAWFIEILGNPRGLSITGFQKSSDMKSEQYSKHYREIE